MTNYDLDVISLGAGVQSSAMLAMACEGVFSSKPTHAIFADTQSEPPWVYEQLAWLEKTFGSQIKFLRVTDGSLENNLYWGGEGRSGFAQIPAYLDGERGRGIGRRQCTYQYKIKPLQRACRELLGLKKGQRAAGRFKVRQWIGISTDESHRAKPSDVSWIERFYPMLFDVPTRRSDCLWYMAERGYPIPRKSSCFFCPYHRDREWRQIRDDAPELWERAIKLDADLRSGSMACSVGLRGGQYLHDSLSPLGEVDLDSGRDQPDLFGNECEGVCGV